MGISYKVTWNKAEFDRILNQQTVPQAVWRAAGKVRDRAKVNITRAGRVDTGAMRSSIVGRRLQNRSGVWYEVGSDLPYAIFQHEGTRDHGPTRAKVMRFQPKGSSTFVFAKKVKGVKASPFLTDALRTLSVSDFLP